MNHFFHDFSTQFKPKLPENHYQNVKRFLEPWNKFLLDSDIYLQLTLLFKPAKVLHSAMFQIGSTKALGPDGIPAIFLSKPMKCCAKQSHYMMCALVS